MFSRPTTMESVFVRGIITLFLYVIINFFFTVWQIFTLSLINGIKNIILLLKSCNFNLNFISNLLNIIFSGYKRKCSVISSKHI